ncbi:SRPBCC family protein [Tenacibaculum xiamenense]|uniref:SRPBCC family protein n=1 Tax=Tenacibaculum xiamenense TaxID=1261553 RepID=UPI0038937968
MPTITLLTRIQADKSIVFNLSRSIELHLISSKKNKEKVVGGRKSGLIELGETVTWRAKHLGVYQNFTSKIIGCETDKYFADEMTSGAFESFKHEHYFFEKNDCTFQIDVLEFKSPFGVLGKLVDFLFLKTYMANFLKKRNETIKEYAESEKWKEIVLIA